MLVSSMHYQTSAELITPTYKNTQLLLLFFLVLYYTCRHLISLKFAAVNSYTVGAGKAGGPYVQARRCSDNCCYPFP